jgi:hypothetical protein
MLILASVACIFATQAVSLREQSIFAGMIIASLICGVLCCGLAIVRDHFKNELRMQMIQIERATWTGDSPHLSSTFPNPTHSEENQVEQYQISTEGTSTFIEPHVQQTSFSVRGVHPVKLKQIQACLFQEFNIQERSQSQQLFSQAWKLPMKILFSKSQLKLKGCKISSF